MGLDMYLEAHRYVGGWDHTPDEDKDIFRAVASAIGLTDFISDGSPSITVKGNIGYWRKANQIHKWFVDNVQDEDDCKDHYVGREYLSKLRALCQRILEAPPGTQQKLAADLLPPQSGFFFGETDLNEWYFKDLQDTVKIVDKCLGMPESFEFYYRSSW